MNKYPQWHTEEQRQELRESMIEQAFNNIVEDPDRIEKYIKANADVIQDILFRHGAYKHRRINQTEMFEMCAKIGAEIASNVLLGIEDMAEEDVEHQI